MATNLFRVLWGCRRDCLFPVSFELPFLVGSGHPESVPHLSFASVVWDCSFAAAVLAAVPVFAVVAAAAVVVVVAVVAAVVAFVVVAAAVAVSVF